MLGRTGQTPSSDSPVMPAGLLRVAVVLSQHTAETLDKRKLAMPGTEIEVLDTGLAGFQTHGPLQRWADVVIIEVDGKDAQAVDTFERFCRDQAARLPVIGAVQDLDMATARSMLRAQAVDVVSLPLNPTDLLQAIEHGRERLAELRPATIRRNGKVVSFVGALGGIGVTALATQAGLIWSETHEVCLIDLDVQFGSAALYVNVRSQLSIADLIEAGERLDAELLRSVAEVHPSGMHVISSPPEILPLEALTPDFVSRLIDLAAEIYDVVLIDLPGAWVSWSLAALQKSDVIALVTGVSVAGIHQARRQLELLDANGLADRLRLVANQVSMPLFGHPDLSEAEKLLRRHFAYAVADDSQTMSTALDEGRRIGSVKMKSRLEKDLRYLVALLAEAHSEAPL